MKYSLFLLSAVLLTFGASNAFCATIIKNPSPIPTPHPPPIGGFQLPTVVWEVQPSNGTAGAALMNFSVGAVNSSGTSIAFLSGSTCTVQVYSGPNGAAVGGTYQVAPSGSELTFSDVVLDAAGTYSLQVGCTGMITSAASAPFTVGAGGPANIQILSQPATSAVNGQTALGATVLVTDAYGNPIQDIWGDVGVGLAGPGASNPYLLNQTDDAILSSAGNLYMQEPTAGGIATFSNIVITSTQAGSYNLVFSIDSPGATGESQSISVVNPAGTITWPKSTPIGAEGTSCDGLQFYFQGVLLWVYGNVLTPNGIVNELLYSCEGSPEAGGFNYATCGITMAGNGSGSFTAKLNAPEWAPGWSACKFSD